MREFFTIPCPEGECPWHGGIPNIDRHNCFDWGKIRWVCRQHLRMNTERLWRILLIYWNLEYQIATAVAKRHELSWYCSRTSRAGCSSSTRCALCSGGKAAGRLQCTTWFHQAGAASWAAQTGWCHRAVHGRQNMARKVHCKTMETKHIWVFNERISTYWWCLNREGDSWA